eukprot:TRINITY_DN397_c0_g1_i1.p1 TRINITY_DN397_c0_g1~~TRINITY_DN397_c0_g1_i1.p1  ORF type:complete len:285 (+),score=37.92 TRINITY_DN397_c0_g1_i1:569-1423(+)
MISPRLSSYIPIPFSEMVDHIRKYGLHVPGIFRVSGLKTKIIAIKKLYDLGKMPDLQQYDINDVAGVLKLWLRDMPEPILPFNLYEPFMAATSVTESEEGRVECIREVVQQLGRERASLLRYLVSFLREVAANSEKNLMSPRNLAIVFTPTCFRPRNPQTSIEILFGQTTNANSLFETFITRFDSIFTKPKTTSKLKLKGSQVEFVMGTLVRATVHQQNKDDQSNECAASERVTLSLQDEVSQLSRSSSSLMTPRASDHALEETWSLFFAAPSSFSPSELAHNG